MSSLELELVTASKRSDAESPLRLRRCCGPLVLVGDVRAGAGASLSGCRLHGPRMGLRTSSAHSAGVDTLSSP